MASNELVVYGENGEILECNFNRVDFEQPSTILAYGGEVKDEIGRILDTTAQMAIDTQEVIVDDKMINSITSFDESLDERDKMKGKKDLALVKGLKGLLSTLGVEKFKKQEDASTYKGRYQEYCEKIQEVAEAVERQKQESLNDIELRKAIISELEPLIKQLEEMIKVGRIDKEAYDNAITALKALPQSIDNEYDIQYRTQLSEVFNGKIDELQKALILYKEQIQSYRLQQKTDMELVMSADSYIRDSAPILKAQGSVMVFNRQQATRLTTMARLNDATNEAIVNNAHELEQNAQGAVALSINKGVTVETLNALNSSLKKGIEIFRNGRAQKQAQIAEDRQSLEQLSSSLETYQQELFQLIDDDNIASEVLKGSSTLMLSKKAPQKKLGSKK